MKLTMLFLLFGLLQAEANVNAQGSITLNAQQTEIAKVLNKIEKKGEFRFLYNYDLSSLRTKVTVDWQNTPINEALSRLFKNTDLTFKVLTNNLIVVLSNKLQRLPIRITGTVTGDNNEPLSGVSVQIRGSSAGTSTNNKGEYTLTVEDSATLIFSYIGYTTKEVAVGGQNVVNAQLTTSSKALDQVVVIGYGSQRKADITSAVSTISVKDVSSRPVISTSEVLAGKAPGVQVFQPSGAPGSDFSVRIRGIASPNGAEPIYVIDGVVAGDTKSLDPNTIESISVLKDAAAAGIYGAAGSTNGVVLITTKQGSKGKTRTDINAYTGIQQITKKLDVLNNQQYLSLLQDEYTNAHKSVPTLPNNFTANNNWQDLIYHTAVQTGANATFSGGSQKGTWLLGLGYLNQDGIVHTSNFKRYSINFKLEQNMNDWLSVGSHISYNRSYTTTIPDGTSAQHGGTILAALTTPPIVPVIDAKGVYGSNFDGTANPVGNIYDQNNSTAANNLLGDVHVEIKLPFNIKYRSSAGLSLEQYNYNYFLNPFNNAYGISIQGLATNTSQEVLRYTLDNTLTWNRSFGDHNFNVVVGTETINEKYYNNSQSGRGFATAAVPTLNAASSNQSVYSYQTDWAVLSYFGRVNYSYKDKYLFTGSLRADGSSRVGINNQYGYFPAFSGGWRVSKEDFMDNIHFIEDLKVRAGWGETGNLPPAGVTVYPSYTSLNPGAPYIFGGNPTPGVILANPIGNSGLKWEAGQQLNIGFDLAVLKGRVSLSADYYNKKTKNLIFTETLPATNGNDDGQQLINLPGYDQNRGFEFSLTGVIVKTHDFDWTATVNTSFNKNRIYGLDSASTFYYGGIEFGGGGTNQYVSVVKNGLPLGAFYGYKALGVDPATGYEKFADLNHDGVIDPNHDRTYLGSGLPTFIYSFVNNLTYKNFGLDLLFDGVGGNKIFDASAIETQGMSSPNNATTEVLRRWRKPGDITDVPLAQFGDSAANSRISSRFIQNGAFFRLKSATLSYHLSTEGLKHAGIYGMRFYVTGQNLFTITGYKGYNPEVNQAGTSSTALGIDYGTYPQSRIYTVGVNLEL
ncbi:TonB-dependent receptor [Puia dinghuensis]|uniref:SusC/RagA family TonB-linked outer membrane protein n=1 Tax=Puia dinghuensis TaxID=1792502 RepID=A0A8J2UFW9_9BACT|nr:TonB-dependent receptor [Puia dinghuensis]GGB12165.1 SusC/RagA family TonB-linked outer membrane protein [Puia dinghuensis]